MGREEQVVKDRLQKLVKRMKELGYNDYMIERAKERVNELKQRGVYCVDRFVQKLLDRIGDKEAYLDILMEGRFAIILAKHNFSDIEIEYAEKGADLKARWNRKTVYFEVTRRHSEVDEWGEGAQEQGAFFVLPDKVENTISRIRGKLSQLQNSEINIVVIWSDTLQLLPPSIKEAFKYIKREINDDPEKYKSLSGVLFTEGGGVDIATLKQFYLFKNDKASQPIGPRLTLKLESLRERDLQELQKEIEEMLAALKQLGSSRD